MPRRFAVLVLSEAVVVVACPAGVPSGPPPGPGTPAASYVIAREEREVFLLADYGLVRIGFAAATLLVGAYFAGLSTGFDPSSGSC